MLSANKVDQLIIRAEWWLQTEDLKSQVYESFGKGIEGEEDSYVIDPYDRIQIKELNIQEDLEEPYTWLRLQAITCYQKALQIDSKHVFALTRLGLLYLSIADEINGEVKKQYLDKALTNVKRAFDLISTDPTINFILGYIFGFYDIDQEKSKKHFDDCHKVSPCFFITIEQDADEILNYKITDEERVSVFLNYHQLREFYRYAINGFPDPALMWVDLMEIIQLSPDGSLHLPEQYREALIQVPEGKRQTLGCKILQLVYFHSLASGEHSDRNLALEVYKEFFNGQGFEWLKGSAA